MYLDVYNVLQMPLNYGQSVIKFSSVQFRSTMRDRSDEPSRQSGRSTTELRIAPESNYSCFINFIVHWLKQITRKEMFYLSMHSTHCIYSYMASDIW